MIFREPALDNNLDKRIFFFKEGMKGGLKKKNLGTTEGE